MNNLALSRLALMIGYLSISAWVALTTIYAHYEPLLLVSLTLNLIVFLVAVVLKRSDALTASWVWLGVNFLANQATLAGMSYLWMVCSVLVILAIADLSIFLEFLYPMRTGMAQADDQQYERLSFLLDKRARSDALFVASAGALSLIGLALIRPLGVVSDPLLAVGVILSMVLVLALVLSLELRGVPQSKARAGA